MFVFDWFSGGEDIDSEPVSVDWQEEGLVGEEDLFAKLEQQLGTKFFAEDEISQANEAVIEVDEDQLLTVYEINKETIQHPYLEKVDERLEVLQEDSDSQQLLWEMFRTLIPPSNRKYIGEFGFYTDGPDETLAYVEQLEDDPAKWAVYIDQQDGKNLSSIFATMIHEYAHILSLNEEQIEVNEEAFFYGDEDLIEELRMACSTLYLEEGCLREDAYLNHFYGVFWKEQLQAQWEDEVDQEDDDSVFAFYEQYENQFVNDYAATSVAEDFAETFAYFVLQPKSTNDRKEKILFFYEYPELVQLREQILNGIQQFLSKES